MANSMASGTTNRAKEGVTVTTPHTYTPPPPLSAFVERFWLREEDAQPHPLERALPTGTRCGSNLAATGCASPLSGTHIG